MKKKFQAASFYNFRCFFFKQSTEKTASAEVIEITVKMKS